MEFFDEEELICKCIILLEFSRHLKLKFKLRYLAFGGGGRQDSNANVPKT